MNKVCAGIVSFNPDIERLTNVVQSIFQQVDFVVVVDNASTNKNQLDLLKDFENVIVLYNKTNEGIAYALNQICCFADNKGCLWALTLDQDTICPENMIHVFSKYKNYQGIGILCPAVFYEKLGLLKRSNADYDEVYACMTSGSMTYIQAWKKVGGFREDYFIDYVDNEFCMKLLLNHYKILRINSCVMSHQLGETKQIKILNRFNYTVSVHCPWRYYYMTRNYLLFIWQYKKNLNIFKEYLKLGTTFWNGLLYSDDRKTTAHYILKGIKDARNGVCGRLSENR